MEFLEAHKHEVFTTLTPGGNHGDTLIHMGMIKKLKEKKIKYSPINLEKLYNDNLLIGLKYLTNIALWKTGSSRGFKLIDIPPDTDLILFEGGGYMSDIWYGPTLLQQVIQRNPRPIAVAPQSYLFNKTNLNSVIKGCREVTLFCREKYSKEHLRKLKLPPSVEIKQSQDTALYLEKEDLKGFIKPIGDDYELLSFRKDKESIISKKTKKSIRETCFNPVERDISKESNLGDFISWVANAKEVFTDRLHVAILGHVLDKKTTLFANIYHKNKGVWEYSLRESIKFHEIPHA